MRNWPWTLLLAAAAVGLLFGQAAPAQETLQLAAPQWGQPGPLASRIYYPEQPTPAPVPDDLARASAEEEAAPPPPQPEPAGAAESFDPAYQGSACGNACGNACRTGCDACCGLRSGKPFKLIDTPGLRCRGINVGGWLQQGITFNADNPADRFNGPVATNDRDTEWQMNQLWLFAERPINTGGCGWDLGGRVDVLYGCDARFGVNHGLENRINSLDDNYGIVIPQAYLEVGFNNLSVKLGHFAAILDYEAIPGVANPFYSHSYSYGYTVPQLVTGALATYKLSDQWSIAAGFHRGWMMFEDVNDDLDFMGGLFWNSRDKRTSINFALSTGAQDPFAGENNRFVSSLVLKRAVTKRFQYILVQNIGYEDNAVTWLGGPAQDAEWYGVNQYFLYQINPCWSAGARVEWLRDDDGARIFGVPNAIPPIRTWPGGPGFAGDFYEVSLGLNWRPHPNILVRPECRWDWYDGLPGFVGRASPRGTGYPFDSGLSDDQFTFATDLIVTY